MAANIQETFGALLVGVLFTSILAGISNLQTVLYYRSYRKDPNWAKALVFLVWYGLGSYLSSWKVIKYRVLDNAHTGLIWSGLWFYFIGNYGEPDKIDHIPWCMALTVILTALITVSVHCFLVHRIFLLSNRNWYMTIPVLVLTCFRLACASVTTLRMLEYQSFELLKLRARWIFTLGLAVSSIVDVLIFGLLVYLFRSNRTGTGRFNHILDKLILYGLETGSLTCVGTIISMLCWVLMPQNLIFLGLYFVIGKLYANSLFITLNTRKSIRPRRETCLCKTRNPVLVLEPRNPNMSAQFSVAPSSTKVPTVHIDVREKSPL
ncbi:hypothetical protein B0H19DRAFT_1381274 [Mycena capillaripes]|nr:hypothetical protein B0H19DRAFT_1381274 [Mycena capillaripes]